MKKIISKGIILILIFQAMLPMGVHAWSEDVQKKINEANEQLKKDLNFGTDYYGDTNFPDGKLLNSYYVENGLFEKGYPTFVYGTEEEASEAADAGVTYKDGEDRCIGFTKDGSLYSNPDFPADYPMSGKADEKNFVEAPWNKCNDISLIGRFLKDKEAMFDKHKLESLGKADIYRKNIQMGIGLQYGIFYEQKLKEKSLKQIQDACKQLSDGYTGNKISGKYKEIEWEKYTHVTQPPTDKSWGMGILFHESGGKYYYFTIPLPPNNLIEPTDDLEVSFESLPIHNDVVSARIAQEVTVSVNVASTFKESISTVYSWDIRDSSTGEPISGVTYTGFAEAESGRIEIKNTPGEEYGIFYASFIMPEKNVTVKFQVNNEAGDDPKEDNLENNQVEAEIRFGLPHVDRRPYDLDYNVLSRDIAYPLANGNAITASVSKPKGSWTSNATGNLNVSRTDTNEYLDNYAVENNPPVDEPSSSVTRKPIITGTILSEPFGDDPRGGNYHNPSNPWDPLIGYVGFTYSGSISRDYEWSHRDSDGDRCYHSGTASGSFDSGFDTLDLKTYVYNGRKDMPDVASRHFKKIVEKNSPSGNARDMYWVSDPYTFDVIRWMCHKDVDGNEYGYEEVYGQYQRTFTQQNTGDIQWKVEKSMSNTYKGDRDAARSIKNQNKNNYPNVVFATDRELQGFAYPIKSGYYITPAGEYSFTVKTVMYKNTPDNTVEHQQLVEKIKDAFHYQSDIEFIFNDKTVDTIDLTADDNKIEGTSMLKFETDYDKDVEKLCHTTDSYYGDSDSYNHPFIKEILEGYSDSNTQDSKDYFKYREYLKREYLKEEAHIYKVMEETTVTITVNPNKKKLYTYANMKDSDNKGDEYYIRAWFEDVSLNSYRYSGLTVKGKYNTDTTALDVIRFTVKGSMYDDLNN